MTSLDYDEKPWVPDLKLSNEDLAQSHQDYLFKTTGLATVPVRTPAVSPADRRFYAERTNSQMAGLPIAQGAKFYQVPSAPQPQPVEYNPNQQYAGMTPEGREASALRNSILHEVKTGMVNQAVQARTGVDLNDYALSREKVLQAHGGQGAAVLLPDGKGWMWTNAPAPQYEKYRAPVAPAGTPYQLAADQRNQVIGQALRPGTPYQLAADQRNRVIDRALQPGTPYQLAADQRDRVINRALFATSRPLNPVTTLAVPSLVPPSNSYPEITRSRVLVSPRFWRPGGELDTTSPYRKRSLRKKPKKVR